jgi:hypothetical protein
LIFFKDVKDYTRAGNSDTVVGEAELEVERVWQRSWRLYWSHLDEIADRLGAKAYNFFRFCHNEAGLHDGYLLSFNLGDSIFLSEASYPRLRFSHGPSSVAMTILNYEKTRLYRFVFKGPRKVVVDIPSADPLFFEEGKTLGQIYHYEICSVTPRYLSVEWLLDSGGTILIEFEKLSYSCKRIKVPELKKRRLKLS